MHEGEFPEATRADEGVKLRRSAGVPLNEVKGESPAAEILSEAPAESKDLYHFLALKEIQNLGVDLCY